MDLVQLVIVIISLVLTALIVFLGVQVWFILREMRAAFQKMNKMLDDLSKVTGTVGDTASSMSGIISGLRAGLAIFSGLRKKGEDDE